MTDANAQGLKPEAMLQSLRQGTIAAVNFNDTVVEKNVRAALRWAS